MTMFTGMFSSLHFQKFLIFCLWKSVATWLILRKENALLPVQLREDYSPGVNLKSLTSEVRASDFKGNRGVAFDCTFS